MQPPGVVSQSPQETAGTDRHRTAEPAPALAVEGIVKRFGKVQALAGVDLGVRAGEVVALLGRNGAGKSTLIRVLAGSVIPDGGSVWIDGADALAQRRLVNGAIGLVLGEDRSFFWRLSGRQNLEFFAAMHGVRRGARRAEAERTLDAVGLIDVAERRVDRYSTGMRSRLGIARALLGRPRVLLLDEPTRSLDPAAAAEVREVVRSEAAAHGAAVLLATHDLHEAASLAGRTVVLDAGRVAFSREGAITARELELAVTGRVQ